MRVDFVGRGNVATQMSHRLIQAGCNVAHMYGRGEIPSSPPDILIIAVTDREITTVISSLPPLPDTLVLHTSGSVPIDVFDTSRHPRCGVVYPLQTILKDVPTQWDDVPLFIEGDDPMVATLAHMLSPNVAPLNSNDRCRLHAAAAIACNLPMFLWHGSRRTMQQAGLDFKLLEPLMRLTLQRALQGPPHDTLTGPASRGDIPTLQRHMQVIPPDLVAPYAMLSQCITDSLSQP